MTRRRTAMTTKPAVGPAAAAVIAAGVAACMGNGGGGTAASTSTAFAPYVDTSLAPAFDLVGTTEKTGVKEFNLAFVTARDGRCIPQWGGERGLEADAVAQQIDDLRAKGGDVRISFGGQTGTELARACSSVDELERAYEQVIDAYALTKADFDIEGDAVPDTAANTRRAQAIARLQKSHPNLDVSLTLATLPDGIPQKEMRMLVNARNNGVRVSAVNILAMDYSPAHTGDMGAYAVQAANATQKQVKKALAIEDDATAWRTLAVTSMIGVNDIETEVFKVDDAQQLKEFADSKGLAWLSMWSANRDRQCADGATKRLSVTCSGVKQSELEFTRTFT